MAREYKLVNELFHKQGILMRYHLSLLATIRSMIAEGRREAALELCKAFEDLIRKYLSQMGGIYERDKAPDDNDRA